jgi:hypothetical protein
MFTMNTHQWTIPDLVKNRYLYAVGKALTQCVQAVAQLFGMLPGNRFGTSERAEAYQRRGDALQFTDLGPVYRNPAGGERSDRSGLGNAVPNNGQVRRQRDYLFQINAGRIADAGQMSGLWRLVAKFGRADHTGTGASGKQQFGQVRSKGDNPLRGSSERYPLSGVVDNRNLFRRMKPPVCAILLGRRGERDSAGHQGQQRPTARFRMNFSHYTGSHAVPVGPSMATSG